MYKLYLGNMITIITTLLLCFNLSFIVWGLLNYSTIQNWSLCILLIILLHGVFWYFANIRDGYSNSIVHAIDGSKDIGIFSVNSMQSIIFWIGTILIWLAAIIAIWNPSYRQAIFLSIAFIACIQFLIIETSRIVLYVSIPSRFDYR